ncbi:MAG: hypothetical protein GF353_04720 [Candidatus Lokiarchaeota archaeon]|nr:hypothetical protein [Candidatus Lokiarchaeota archaeon]
MGICLFFDNFHLAHKILTCFHKYFLILPKIIIKITSRKVNSTFHYLIRFKEEVHKALINVILNAIKNTPPNGLIEIETSIEGNYALIKIKDNGIGFTEREKQQIFEKFGKIERYGEVFDLISEGTGLGLYIANKIIKMHDGEIWVESEGKYEGSTFYITLPLKKK